jgi:SAM-dependent methyltransferase
MSKVQKEWWNSRFINDVGILNDGRAAEISKVLTDKPWMDSVPEIGKMLESLGGGRLLDLGCGLGMLSRHFNNKGFDVTAVDFSENALAVLKSHSPNVKTCVHDMTQVLPFEESLFDIVVANLSLHYFNEEDTHRAIFEVKRVLKPGGILIGAVVSTEEFEVAKKAGINFIEIEPNFYHELHSDGRIKHIRFFSRDDINRFFKGFDVLYLNNGFDQRMGKTKGAWEFVMRKE